VLLTGGTGFVGRFLLTQLLQDTDATIYCLARGKSQREASSRLRATLAQWDLWRDEYEPRIVAVPADVRAPRLGIDANSYQLLSREVDSIYHCATSMNYLESYAMARPANVESASELLRLATDGKPKLVNYISTLSIFSATGAESARVVNEATPIDHERHPATHGYAASKWVAEKIFMQAAERGIPCNIFRLGLVWPDTRHGRYDELQEDYRLFKSCLLSGFGIRNYRYDVAPIPVDHVARSVVFLAERHGDGQGIFHISASGPLERIFERCNEVAGTSLELVSHYDWIREIRRLHQQGLSLPIVPLVEFAFSMDEEAFAQAERRLAVTNVALDCTRTNSELERGGIVPPAASDELISSCVAGMLSRDAQLRAHQLAK
jgi:thioester reductase-like protein